jgi:DNA uptake protein ComE-like DNA-binding protein
LGVIAALLGLAMMVQPPGDAPAAATQAPHLRLDPSTADPELLIALPRLGPGLVDAIVAARRDGPFASPEEFQRRVKGIGPVTLEQLRPYLRFGPDQDTGG